MLIASTRVEVEKAKEGEKKQAKGKKAENMRSTSTSARSLEKAQGITLAKGKKPSSSTERESERKKELVVDRSTYTYLPTYQPTNHPTNQATHLWKGSFLSRALLLKQRRKETKKKKEKKGFKIQSAPQKEPAGLSPNCEKSNFFKSQPTMNFIPC